VADTLSRPPPVPAQQLPTSSAPTAEDWPEEGLAAPERPILAAIAKAQAVDFSAMAAAQRYCPEVKEMMNSNTLQITTQAVGDASQLRDISTGVFRLLVPIEYREAVFQSLHSIHHPGVRSRRRLIAARFCWPQMAKAITLMARACMFCQRGKIHKHVHLQPAEIPVPHRRFAHIHVDLVGPLPPSHGHTYLFTIIDRTLRWPEAVPLSSITAADCARALFAGWVSRFDVPATITSDRGAQFMSALWEALCSLLNIQHSPTTAYHPPQRAGRAVPRAAEGRPAVLVRRRRMARPPAVGDDRNQSVIPRRQRVFTSGGSIRLAADPAGSVRQHRRVAVAILPQGPSDRHDRPPAAADVAQLGASPIDTTGGVAAGLLRSGPPERCAAAAVPVYDGPYRVLEQSTHFFLLEMGERIDKISTLCIKAARKPIDTEPAKPPRRGRPAAQAPPVRAPPPSQRGRP